MSGIKQALGSVMENIFGNSRMAAPPPQAPVSNSINTPPQMTTAASPGTSPNGVIPANGANPPEGGEVSPLKKFADVWNTTPEDPNKPNGPQALTSDQMLEAASKVDFTKVIDQSMLQKITAGGEGAVEALAAILNKQSQTVYGQSTVVAQKLIEKAVSDAEARFAAQIPTLVKKQSLRESLGKDNPAFKDPAVAPLIQAIQAQLAEKHPGASVSELQELAQEYFTGAAEAFRPTRKPVVNPKDAPTDWESYLTN